MRLSLGTAQFGLDYGISNKEGRVNQKNALKIIKLARQSKINTIDTAIAYGVSEECLGKIGVKDFQIVTKLPPIPSGRNDIYKWALDQFQSSIKRLNVESIYGLLLHNSYDLLGENANELFEAMLELKREKKLLKIGVSIYSPSELLDIINKYEIDIIQSPLNLIDRRLEESGWLLKLKDMGIEVHTRSTFLQGLLLMKLDNIPSKFLKWSDLFLDWHDWLKKSDFNAIQACLAYPLSMKSIDKVIIGVDDVNQLKEILGLGIENHHIQYPKISSLESNLINPSMWKDL